MKTKYAVAVLWLAAAFCAEAADRKIYVEEYRDRMAGAWLGQSVGVAYGAPTEFRKKGELVTDDMIPAWKPERVNNTFQQDDLYVEMSFLETLEKRGVDVGAREAGIDFANSRYRLWCANSNARNNLRRGIAAPDSSHPKNHPTPDDIDYQIEADFSGILSPGMPARVLKFGQSFGRIMNYGDGVYAGDFMGGMYAAAYFEKDRVKVVEAGLKCIPSESWYAEMVRDMLAWYKEDPKDWKAAWKKAVEKYGTEKSPRLGKVSFAAIDVKINGAMVLLGYLWGDGDVMKTMDVATRGGYDSDCNPSSALGVLGVQLGFKGFGPQYASKLDKKATWEYTPYTWDKLLAVCEKLTRDIVVREGGKIASDEKGEYFLIPEKPAVPGAAVSSAKPEAGGDARLTDAEMAQILYAPCSGQGAPSQRKSLPPPAAPVVKDGDKIAFLGDSITQFGNNPAGYVNMVMKGLELAGVKAVKIPAGISGHKSNNMLQRVDRDCLAKRPRFMTVSCGVNDVWHGKNGVPLEDFKRNMSAIFDKAAASNVAVVVLTPTLIGEDANNANNKKLDAYVDWLCAEAARRGLPLADLNAQMRYRLLDLRRRAEAEGRRDDGKLATVDGVHMNFEGNRMMAWGVLRALGVQEKDAERIWNAWRDMPGAHRVTVELSEAEHARLLERAKKAGKTAGDYLRASCAGE
ncbi:MAG: ADP-ribosylglycohydrolase family protein [Kiritimatiellae bacterium]|nr:ADP-ribosylglycohydrolase family protein [Kiritimatiellia bacterium]